MSDSEDESYVIEFFEFYKQEVIDILKENDISYSEGIAKKNGFVKFFIDGHKLDLHKTFRILSENKYIIS